MTQQHHRIYTFDLLRGIAVITMMLAHAVYFFHNRSSDFLIGLEGFGNVVSFGLFLLVSGASSFVAYFSGGHTPRPDKRRRIFSRIILFLLAYYLLAFIFIWADLVRAEGLARIRLALDVLSFRFLPGFTEYFPPFIFYSTLLVLFPRFFLISSRTILRVVIVSLTVYLAGMALYQIPSGDFIRPWVAILAGAEGMFRFPLFQYLPVFLLGLYWGRRMVNEEGLPAKRALVAGLAWFFVFVAIAAFIISFFLDIPLDTIFSRWPPSIPFLALGLGFAFVAATILFALHQLRTTAIIRNLLLVFGQNALGFFWSHILLLSLYAAAGGDQVSSIGLYVFLFLLLMVLSLALTTFLPFNYRLALTSVRGSHEEHEEALEQEAVFRLSKGVAAEAAIATKGLRGFFFPDRRTTSPGRFRKRHKLGISLIAIATAALVFPATTEEIALQRQERGADIWWSSDYAYRQPLTLTNPESFIDLEPGTPVTVNFDHQMLVEEGKSRADGQDLKVIYWTGEQHLVADTVVMNPASDRSSMTFRLPIKLEGGKEDEYFSLYYGGFNVASIDTSLSTGMELTARFRPEEMYPLIASVAKRWNLIGQPESETVQLNVTAAKPHQLESVTYEVIATGLTGTMFRSSDTSWEADIPVDTLSPGAYSIRVTLTEGETTLTSNVTGFYRSHPLYIVWTHDWEGYDVNQAYLEAMESIATQYALPITHFFNPRIYITTTIKPQRAGALTQWVQRRLELGDGFGLHLHMFTDYVDQAGVTSKLEPNWGDTGSGYGVPLSAYSKDEQTRLIRSAQDLLVGSGFPRTTIFRAGGWYANLDTFRALEQLGFTVDSSARTAYQFGRNKLPGHWKIEATTKPYYPSRTNQNVSATANNFPILEIPNNGADSYAFSAEDMIDRFTANLGSGLLSQPQQVTYLSHPHWFDDKEQARVRELFTYISRYASTADQGPVIFTTTNDIAEVFADE